MMKRIFHFYILSGCCLSIFFASASNARDNSVKVVQLLQTTRSWDGSGYAGYPAGQPQITILKIYIPPKTALNWHHHPMISAAYVLSGQIVLEKKDTRERQTFRAGQALAETVNTVHRGFTTDQPVELIVFYAGAPGMPLSIKAK